MDALYVILLIVIIVLLISNQASLRQKIDNLEFLVNNLQSLVKKLSESKLTTDQPKATVITETKPSIISEMPKLPVEPVKPITSVQSVPPTVVEHIEELIADPLENLRKSQIKSLYDQQAKAAPEPRPSFFEQHPDLEKFIGENLVNKIGIAILVLAIGFFVKYAIDNNWVGPAGRVAIGIVCGGILIGIAHRLRKSYKAFSSVLVGGGLAVFYFTITLAFHQFHLFSQTVSFIILIVITCFAVVLSLLYDRQELAVIALIGGFSSPFMVSTGTANYNALFIYLIVLNAGLLIIAYNRSWRILNISSFVLTVLVLAGIIYTLPVGSHFISFIYITVLYLLFFFITIANNIKENKKFITSDFTVLLVNAGLYFGTGLYLLTMMHAAQYRGLFSASIGALNLLFSFILFRSKKAEINILYLLIGITLTFISLTAPIQLHGHFITLFWAAECVVIYWLYVKSKIKLMQIASTVIWGAMICSLCIDWINLYSSSNATYLIIGNKGFITTLVSAISCFLFSVLVSKTETPMRMLPAAVFKFTGLILLFAAGALEINHQFLNRYPGTGLHVLYLMLYYPTFVYVYCQIADRMPSMGIDRRLLALKLGGTVLVYLIVLSEAFDLQYVMLIQHKVDPSHFIVHWVSAAVIILIIYKLVMIWKEDLQTVIKPVSWIISAAIVIFLSLELSLLSNRLFYTNGSNFDHVTTIYVKTALPVLWGLTSFALMWLGMRYKTRVLRIISLTLFSITLVKLFVFDIENIPAAGKIAAFFCLGGLLLIISFMYQKVKNIIADDKPKE